MAAQEDGLSSLINMQIPLWGVALGIVIAGYFGIAQFDLTSKTEEWL